MHILAFDTTLDVCTAALSDPSGGIFFRHEKMSRGQAERLPVMLQEIMAEAEIEYSDLGLIAVTIGPGTFSGTRIGLAAARALSIVAPVPVLGLTSLFVIAAGVSVEMAAGRPIWAINDARRSEFYVQGFAYHGVEMQSHEEPVRCAQVGINEVIDGQISCVLVGSGSAIAAQTLPVAQIADASDSPDARVVATLAKRIISRGETLPDGMPEPLYLRPPDAKIPTKSSLV